MWQRWGGISRRPEPVRQRYRCAGGARRLRARTPAGLRGPSLWRSLFYTIRGPKCPSAVQQPVEPVPRNLHMIRNNSRRFSLGTMDPEMDSVRDERTGPVRWRRDTFKNASQAQLVRLGRG